LYGDLLYLDSSALVKLIVPEAESLPLLRLLLAWPRRITSHIAFVEVHRAIRRLPQGDDLSRRAEEVLSTISFMDLHFGILGEACFLEPDHLRSLDALHLASALFLGKHLGGFVTYDRNQATAAARRSLKILAPA
jgi:uncharacterized protein